MAGNRSKSSSRWLQEHVSDHHVKQAQASGYRSRAAFKLLQLDEKDNLLRPGITVLELGAAPGGWTQVVSEKIGGRGRIVASDILPMDGLPGVEFIQGDFHEQSVADAIIQSVSPGADLVLSDMAPNITGVAATDQARVMALADLALEMSVDVLKPNGAYAVKLFQGAGFDIYIQELRKKFKDVKLRKPQASRARSREVYVVARNLI